MAEDSRRRYSIDTSSLIKWYDEDYSPDIFEGLPARLAGLAAEGRLRAARVVKEEIKDSDEPDTLAKWCRAQEEFYVNESEGVQRRVREILAQFQNPKKKSGIGGADPFVIALAEESDGDWWVVSEESPSTGNAQKNPNIPFVCRQLGVPHMTFVELLRVESWKLR